MWLIFALLSSLFAGVTAILAKIGVKAVDSNVATAIRSLVILVFTWLMVFVVGSQGTISTLTPQTITFLVLSGLATGGSWICYFKALQLGNVNQVTPVDKSSTILTILLAFLFLGEVPTMWAILGIVILAIGTFVMIEKKPEEKLKSTQKSWLFYAILSAIFASLTAILGKVGMQGVESNLGTAIRTIVVVIVAWGIVVAQGTGQQLKKIDNKSWVFLILSGMTTGLSWLCYYRALQEGPASIVVPIDKLSIVITIFFAHFILKEQTSKRTWSGLALVVIGTMLLLVK